MADQQQYDAFISYRHLPLDHAVAERVQTLLENYKAPLHVKNGQKNKIGRIFRDQSELPTSGNLDDSLKRALASSQFLIVVLSRQTKDSKWCMEEISSFKEAHGGRISHILPILVDGEPNESIPDILRYETRKTVNEDGVVESKEVEVEPLCCDVRSDSIKGSLKKLKTEFLRLCAPMLGVGFDDLYQRHARRRRRFLISTVAAAGVLLTVVLSIISGFAYQTYQAKQERTHNLVDTYARLGASQITAGDYEQALMYYSSVLNLDDETQTAKTGALLLLQQHGWLNHVSDGSGWIADEILYESNLEAFAVDTTGEKLLMSNMSSTYTTDKDGTQLEDLSAYGEFLSGAQDGSCWTFATDDTVTFYFTADSSIAQVPRPKAINPSCDSENTDYYDNLSLSAMAPNKTRAVVCYGGYLYIYNLSEADINGTLYTTFDLSLVFENLAKNGDMPTAFLTWVDAGGNLCIVSDLSSAAVFNITNSTHPCLNSFHEVYGRTLQDVAFSSDGQHYALVYGNDLGIYNNPGGSIEVYDEYGNACIVTDFDGNVPLMGAAFEQNGSRIAAWGNGELRIWDWSTGTEAAAPLKIRDISSAVWLEDGSLAVSDGNGDIRYYTIVEYKANDASIELEEFEEQDYRQNDVELSAGYHIKYETANIIITDSRGEITDERKTIDIDTKAMLINRMYIDDKHSTAYLWSSFYNFIFEIKIDNDGKIVSLTEMNTQRKNPLALYSVWNGVLAEMGTGELFYYDNNSPDTVCILKPGTPGSIQSVASNESGLVSFVIKNQQYTDGYSFEYTYSVELWDLNKCIMLAELERNSHNKVTCLTFSSDEYLAYECGDEIVTLLLDAPTPDKTAIDTLQTMSCYSLDEVQNVQIVDVTFDDQALGNWNNSLHISSKEIQETDRAFTQEMDDILAQQGEDAWLNEYNEWWISEAPENTKLSELCRIMENFFANAKDLDCKNELRGALKKFISIVCLEEDSSIATTYHVSSIIYDVIIYTPENADLVAIYYEQDAAKCEELYKTSGSDEDKISAISSRLSACILKGQKIDSLEIDDNLIDENLNTLVQLNLQLNTNLLRGKPKEAAAIINYFDEQYISEEYSYIIYYPLLRELAGYVRIGAISEADYSTFISKLDRPIGVKVAQVTSEQLEAGLRLDDVVTAVNGIHFGIPQYLNILRSTTPTASFTVVRGESVIKTKAMDNWQIAGGFTA